MRRVLGGVIWAALWFALLYWFALLAMRPAEALSFNSYCSSGTCTTANKCWSTGAYEAKTGMIYYPQGTTVPGCGTYGQATYKAPAAGCGGVYAAWTNAESCPTSVDWGSSGCGFTCVTTCPQGETASNGVCCPTGQIVQNGACVPNPCTAGQSAGNRVIAAYADTFCVGQCQYSTGQMGFKCGPGQLCPGSGWMVNGTSTGAMCQAGEQASSAAGTEPPPLETGPNGCPMVAGKEICASDKPGCSIQNGVEVCSSDNKNCKYSNGKLVCAESGPTDPDTDGCVRINGATLCWGDTKKENEQSTTTTDPVTGNTTTTTTKTTNVGGEGTKTTTTTMTPGGTSTTDTGVDGGTDPDADQGPDEEEEGASFGPPGEGDWSGLQHKSMADLKAWFAQEWAGTDVGAMVNGFQNVGVSIASAGCPSLSFALPWGTTTTTLHCDIWANVAGVFTAVMMAGWTWIAIRVFLSA